MPRNNRTTYEDFVNRRDLRRLAHELNNVFTGILVSCGLLQERLTATDLRRYADNVREGAECGSALVRQMRALLPESAADPGEIEQAREWGADDGCMCELPDRNCGGCQ